MIALLTALAAVIVGLLGWAAFAASQPHGSKSAPSAASTAQRGDASETTSPDAGPSATATSGVGPGDGNTADPPAALRVTRNPDIAEPVLDAFIARQYPGYRVIRRISFPDQWEDGRLSVDYLLLNDSRPDFRILVSVARAKKGDASRELDWPCFAVGDVLTDDEVFSADARRQYGFLTEQFQDAIVDGYLARAPAGNAFVYGAFVTNATQKAIDFSVDAGPGALESAMNDTDQSSPWGVKARVTPGKLAPRIVVTARK